MSEISLCAGEAQVIGHDGKFPAQSRIVGWLALVNIAAVLLFGILLLFGPMLTELSAHSRFTELDRAGVVNAPALKQFDRSYGFGDVSTLEYRRTVPDYVAASALAVQEIGAGVGFAFALVNTIVFLAIWRARRTDVR